MSERFEIHGRSYIAAADVNLPEWTCLVGERPILTLTLKDDDLFLITDILGNISGIGCLEEGIKGSMGLFCRDTRFLSRLELQIDGHSPVLLSSTAHKGFALTVLCANPQIENIKAETIGIKREMVINGGLFEEILITNYNRQSVAFTLSLSFDSDFMDLFEVRGLSRPQRGKLLRFIEPKNNNLEDSDPSFPKAKEIILTYLGLDSTVMESRVCFSYHQPNDIQGNTAIWNFSLEPHQIQTIGYYLHLFTNNHPTSTIPSPVTLMQANAAELLEEKNWAQEITKIRTDNKTINQVIQQAERDLYLLRQTFEGKKILTAGVPWFSTLFGRDSIVAASQTLILEPAIARDTLYVLAQYQGKEDNHWRDEEPGKILHEIRLGEMARCKEIPHTPYYGTVDATPLWLMLYAEYYAWTGDHEILENLWGKALNAMNWIDQHMKASGYLCYERRSQGGLFNQGWKDSEDCIVNSKGQIAKGPIALSEVQAYVYAAKIRMAELAHIKKLPNLTELWQRQARDLKVRFNRDFWMEDQDFCALALDGDGKTVDSITSNPGHCLGLGLLDPEKANNVAERLLASDMFNGWGIRTLSSTSSAYNPMGYHVGSVWPHDNNFIALGLRSIGLVEQALEIAEGLIDMTLMQPYQRPPELFCGFDRIENNSPIQYPVACSPQAWATGTIFQLFQMMLNLVPDAPSNNLRIIEPTLLKSINHLSIENLKVGRTIMDLEFERHGTSVACRVTKKRGNLRVLIEV